MRSFDLILSTFCHYLSVNLQIEGFDDGGGRVIVKLAIGGIKVTLNEFMVQVVGKQEFAKYGKILSKIKII